MHWPLLTASKPIEHLWVLPIGCFQVKKTGADTVIDTISGGSNFNAGYVCVGLSAISMSMVGFVFIQFSL